MANCPEYLFFRQLAIQKLCMDQEHAQMFAQAVTGCTSGDDDSGNTGNGGGSGNDTDEIVKVTSNDINSSYLFNKIVGTGAIEITQINDGGDESLGIGHEDTSSVANVNPASNEVIDTLIFDDYGHVIGFTLKEIDITGVDDLFSVQDTESINLTYSGGILSADAIISSQENNLLSILPDGLFAANLLLDDIIFGGVVSWVEDYDFKVSPSKYILNNITYEIPTNTVVTLDPADPVLDRFDVIYLDNTGNVGVATGVPSETPAQPGLDIGTQIGVGVVFVQAGSTEPVLVVQECITENVTWTATASDASIDPASAVTPCTGGQSVEATLSSSGDYIKFVRGSSFSPLEEMNIIKFQVKPKLDWNDNITNKLKFTFRLAGVIVGNTVTLDAVNTFGFDYNSLACQLISINIFLFGLLDSDLVDEFRIEVESGVPFGWFIDELCLQGGLGTGGNTDEGDFIWNQYFGPQTPGRLWIKNNARVDGWFTSPDMINNPVDAGGSEKFGWGSQAIGIASTAIGNSAVANGQEGATALGRQAIANVGVAIGFGAICTRGISIGGTQTVSGGSAVGWGAVSTALSATALGGGAQATANSSTTLGYSSAVNGAFSNVFGAGAVSSDQYAMAIGNFAQTTADHQIVFGGHDSFLDYGYSSMYFGSGVTSTFTSDRFWTITGSQGTNIAGNSWTFAGAKATGNAPGGPIYLQTSDAGSSGTTLQSLTTKVGLNSNTLGLYLDNTRFQEDEGADVVTANDLTLGTGNTFTVTGNTTVNAITDTNWQDGAVIRLHLTGTPTLKHNTAGGAGTTPLRLAGAVDFTIIGYTVIQLELKDGFWCETNRSVATGGSSGILTGDNALTLSSATNLQWGGTLLHNTTVDATSAFGITFTGSITPNSAAVLTVNNTNSSGTASVGVKGTVVSSSSSSYGILGTATAGVGIRGLGTTGTGGNFTSTSGFGVVAQSTSGVALEVVAGTGLTGWFISGPTSLNTFTEVVRIDRTSSNTPAAAGMGGYISFAMPTSANVTSTEAGRVGAVWTNATSGAETSDLQFWTTNASAHAVKATLKGSGELRLNNYGVGSFTSGTGVYLLATKSDGTVMEFPTGGLPPGGGIITADNGLTMSTATNVQLGGTLINGTTTITAGNNLFVGTSATYTTGGLDAAFTFSNTLATGSLTVGVKGSVVSTNGSSAGVLGTNSGSGGGVYGNNSGSGAGVIGVSSSGLGGDFRSTSGIALTTFTNTGAVSANFTVFPSSTNTIVEVARIARSTSATAANGIGGSFAWYNETADESSTVYESAKIASTWTTATTTSRVGDLQFFTTDAAISAQKMVISGSGVVGIGNYSSFNSTKLDVVDNSVGAASIVNISSTSTAAASNLQKGINVSLSGTNATTTQTTYGGYFSNTHAGTLSTNIGIYGTATSGTTVNIGVYGLINSAVGVSAAVYATNNAAGYGIIASSAGGGTAGNFTSSSGYGVDAISAGQAIRGTTTGASYGVTGATAGTDTGTAILAQPVVLSNNIIANGVEVRGQANTGAAAGFGVSIKYSLTDDTSVVRPTGRIYSSWITSTAASRLSQTVLTTYSVGSEVSNLTLSGDGSVKFFPITATAASAITPSEGLMVFVSDTNGTFTSIGPWMYYNAAWHAL